MTSMSDSIRLNLPSPVRRLLTTHASELWLKDDGRICDVYGGNKPRKLAYLLAEAQRRHAKRLVTVGVIGSHHVLATGLLGRAIGLPTLAITLARPYSSHAAQTTKRTMEAGVDLIPLANAFDLARLLPRLCRRGDFFIPPGGSNSLGARGYVDAIKELKQQIEQRELPEPDHIVVALGTGGTAAGLLAGLARYGLKSHLVAVPVLRLPAARGLVGWMAKVAAREAGGGTASDFSSRITIDDRWIGSGYGQPTTAGELAIAKAAEFELELESTYTGKAFACAWDWANREWGSGQTCTVGPGLEHGEAPFPPGCQTILFWSTFSTVSFTNSGGPAVTLPACLQRLFRSTK
jgi:D-cysteine desulfhydrase